MTAIPLRQTDDVRALEAAMQWALRLRDDEVTGADIAEWTDWYERDARNKRAFDEMQAFWHFSGGLAALPDGPARIQRLRGVSSQPLIPAVRHRLVAPALAAALLVALFLPTAWRYLSPPPAEAPGAAPPLVREQLLSDGSRMQLAARSFVAVQYTDQVRLLQMQDGEAYFTVEPDRNRPFIVEAGRLRVRALGTSFNIRKAGGRVVVTVKDGLVEVDTAHPGAAKAVRLAAGNELKWDHETLRTQIAAIDPASALGWREGRLEYIDEPLSAVIADVNRYAARPVILGDAAAARLSFTGTVFIQSTEEWLQALPREFPVDLVSSGEDALVLKSRGPAAR